MTRLIEQELQSSRYQNEQAGEGCACCGALYAGKGPFCVSCLAPIEISQTVRRRGTPPRFVPVLGASGAGKTVYLGMLLDILSQGTRPLAGLATSAFSVRLQEQTTTALENRRFPDKTPTEAEGWQWVHCEVTHPKRPKAYADIITPDFAGESIAHEIEQPGSYPAIRHVILQAHGLLVLCDSLRVRDASLGEDLFALKLASYLVQLHEAAAPAKGRQAVDQPLAIVLTKSDVCPEAGADPARFAAANLPRLLQFCRRKFAHYEFFASSVVGSSVTLVDGYGCRTQVPLHIEPRGITEPLDWVLGRG
jgi:hypothetical protein